MLKLVVLFVLLAVVSAFLPLRSTVHSSGMSLKMGDERFRDANGKLPGDAGYRPQLREAPTDFAAYQAAEKAKKAAKAAAEAAKTNENRYMDENGKLPGDAGYRPQLREAPTDFAAYQAEMKAKKAAAAEAAKK